MLLYGRLKNLKSWLTLSDSASYLSSIFEEDVSVADVLQLGLEGHLKLSINLVNHAHIKPGLITNYIDTPAFLKYSKNQDESGNLYEKNFLVSITARYTAGELLDSLEPILKLATGGKHVGLGVHAIGHEIEEGKYLNFNGKVFPAEGIWDLPMIGAEKLDVEHYLHSLTEGPEVKLQCLGGALLEDRDGHLYQVQSSYRNHVSELTKAKANLAAEKVSSASPLFSNDSFYPAGGLPNDAVFVVRRENLDVLIGKVRDDEAMEEVGAKTSALLVVASLLDFFKHYREEAGNKFTQKWLIDEITKHYPVSDSTLEKLFPKAKAVLKKARQEKDER